MRFVQVTGVKGGVGTSTVASILGIKMTEDDKRILLVDNGKYPSIVPIIGTPTLYGLEVVRAGLVDLSEKIKEGWDAVIVDNGTTYQPISELSIAESVDYVHVLRNEYLSLRHYTQDVSRQEQVPADFFVCITMGENALNLSDAEMVLGKTAINFEFHSDVARTIDAGMLKDRISHSRYNWANSITAAVNA